MKAKVRVLHIDDNIHDRKLVKDALQKEHDGFQVAEADSREKFENYLAEQNFDIVLSDFNILGFDGLQVLQAVKELKPDLPVIIVTGTGSEEIAIQAMKMGAADYVIKSVKHIQGLAPTIKTVLDNKRINKERINALAALRESEELHRSIYDNSSVAILLTSPDGRIFAANNFACQLFGMTEAEVCKAGRDGLVDPFSPNLAILLEEREKTGRAKGELTFVKKDGTRFQAEVSSVVFQDKDCKQKTSMVIRDLTEQKEAEEKLLLAKEKAEESDRLKTAFLQNISHEIRTPMNAIVGFAGVINEPDLPPEKRQRFADIIVQSSNQLLSIITDIVNIATIEAGQEKVHEKEVNLNSLFRLLYDQFNAIAQKQNILFAYKTGLPDMEALILTDRNKLSETLANLISNALKFTRQGSIIFGYQLKADYLEFYVEDTGIGIPSEMHGEIFKRFRQVETSTNREYGGSGLGLSISKAYVELLGGKIWVNSQPGKGAVFYFTIPYKKTYSGSLPNKQSSNSIKEKSERATTLLIAEDEDSNFALLEALLSESGMNILRATNGNEAVSLCKLNPEIDLVLMDMKMPEMDGYEATRQIKKIRPDLPVIAQTAHTTGNNKKKAFECGCSDFISKPFNKRLLLSKIKEQLSK